MSEIHILDGKHLARSIRHQLREVVVNEQLDPHLAVILVGEDSASRLYVQLKQKAARQVGIEVHIYTLASNCTQTELNQCIDWLNDDQIIDGILLQLPLPSHLDENTAIKRINPKKDADGFHPDTLSQFSIDSLIQPAPAAAVDSLIGLAQLTTDQPTAVVLANHDIFFKPIKILLRARGILTTYCNPADPDWKSHTKTADILIVAIGRAEVITAEDIKPGAVLIDVGTNTVGHQVVGDIDFASVRDSASAISPVPGGVGPMTIACLLKNVLALHRQHNR